MLLILFHSVQDVRPGLAFKQSTKRQWNVEKKQKTVNEHVRKNQKPTRVLEAERREEGLSVAISSENKGFAMLKKMGFDPSKGLGKSGEGRKEPVSVEVKADRAGLGREAALKEIEKKKLAIRARKLNASLSENSINEFRARMRLQTTLRQVISDLGKSQRICKILDEEKGITEPDEIWFWPEEVPEEPEEQDEGESSEKKPKLETEETKEEEPVEIEQFEPSEQLEMLTSYLRLSHFYCIWCGTKYEDAEDLSSTCPGSTRDDH